MSHNRSLDGILDELRSDRLVDGVVVDNLLDSEDDDNDNVLPGTQTRRRADDGSRTTKPTVLTSAIKFSPTGREWAAATTQGLQIFSLGVFLLFYMKF